MSGYASKREAVDVIRETIRIDGAKTGLPRDPAAYNMTGIVRDLVTGTPNYGWGINPSPAAFARAQRMHLRSSARW